ncbi:hypothetical protein STANM309S_00510 [Streptomyces tanashiensis]
MHRHEGPSRGKFTAAVTAAAVLATAAAGVLIGQYNERPPWGTDIAYEGGFTQASRIRGYDVDGSRTKALLAGECALMERRGWAATWPCTTRRPGWRAAWTGPPLPSPCLLLRRVTQARPPSSAFPAPSSGGCSRLFRGVSPRASACAAFSVRFSSRGRCPSPPAAPPAVAPRRSGLRSPFCPVAPALPRRRGCLPRLRPVGGARLDGLLGQPQPGQPVPGGLDDHDVAADEDRVGWARADPSPGW